MCRWTHKQTVSTQCQAWNKAQVRDSKDTGRDYLCLSIGGYMWFWRKQEVPGALTREHCKQWNSTKSSLHVHRARTLISL